jgi:hypothetical protein
LQASHSPWLYPPLSILWKSIFRCLMAPIRKRSITPCPHEAALAEDKSHAQQNPFQSRYAMASRANQRKSPESKTKTRWCPDREGKRPTWNGPWTWQNLSRHKYVCP